MEEFSGSKILGNFFLFFQTHVILCMEELARTWGKDFFTVPNYLSPVSIVVVQGRN
jgi:hypothetical protein